MIVETGGADARLGPIIGLPLLLQELGVAPALAFRQAGVSLELFADADNRVSGEAVFGLLGVCANLSGRSDFGLLLGSRFTLADFGPLGELIRNAATVGEALRMLLLHLRLYDRLAAPILLRAESKSVFLGYSLQHPTSEGAMQLQDIAIVLAYRILRELCGPGWQPQLVRFSHRRPASLIAYRRVFGPAVQFDAVLSGLSFDTAWLEHRIAGAEPERYRALQAALREADADWPAGFAQEVQCVLHQLLAGGSVCAASVAQLFGCSERTLREKLRAEGAGMQHLLAATRFELACHLLQNTELPLARIAVALCYADPAVFSRAFRGWAGVSPRQWRNTNRKQ